ncbi:MAG: GntR family transcriptional regulator [Bryobacteraceae bacterium]
MTQSQAELSEFRFGPVVAPTLKEKIAGQIRKAILTGDLRPGARIVESKLAKQMGVAQTTVREAIQELESTGLVVKHVNRETRVRQLTLGEIEQLFHLRLNLEGLAVELAHPNVDEKSLCSLYRIVAEMRGAAHHNDIADFYHFDVEFHRKLWSLSKHQFLVAALNPLMVGPVAFMLNGAPSRLASNYLKVADEHSEIVDVLGNGTAEVARRMMESKLRHWHEMQLNNIINAPERDS